MAAALPCSFHMCVLKCIIQVGLQSIYLQTSLFLCKFEVAFEKQGRKSDKYIL